MCVVLCMSIFIIIAEHGIKNLNSIFSAVFYVVNRKVNIFHQLFDILCRIRCCADSCADRDWFKLHISSAVIHNINLFCNGFYQISGREKVVSWKQNSKFFRAIAGSITAFSYAAAEQVDIIVCYADGRNDYEASWTLPVDQKDETGKQGMGRSESIWNELNVIGVTDGIYNDTVAISKESPYYTPEMIDALQQCFINIINTDEGQAIFSVYSHTGYAIAKDSDYDGARAALEVVS